MISVKSHALFTCNVVIGGDMVKSHVEEYAKKIDYVIFVGIALGLRRFFLLREDSYTQRPHQLNLGLPKYLHFLVLQL